MIKNINKMRSLKLFILIIFLFCGLTLWAQDFGIVIDQSVDFNAHGLEWDDIRIDYSGAIIPYASFFLGDFGEINLIAGFTYRIDPWFYVPELLVAELVLYLGRSEFRVGRMTYSDPLGIIANGFLDGALFSLDTKAGIFSLGGWYTGYLYKNRAAITMTEDEENHFYSKFDIFNFMDTYFAPKRVLASLAWESPSIGGVVDLQLAVHGQYDLTEAGLNTYYASAKITTSVKNMVFDIGGCYQVIDYMDEFTMAAAASMGFNWRLISGKDQFFSLRGIYSTGVFENYPVTAFLPVTTVSQGNLLKAKLSGISIVSMNFLSYLNRYLAAEFDFSYFVRSDLGTYKHYPVIGVDSEGFLLGPEVFCRFLLNNFSGFQMNIGGGAFLPFMGNAASDANILWRAELNVLFSLF